MRQLMNLVIKLFIAAGAMASVSAWSALPMKPGLWEIQPQIQLQSQNGTMPIPDISQLMQNMSPEMRSQMEAIMQKQGVSVSDNGNIQVCTTRDMIASNRLPQNKDCESVVTKAPGNRYSFHFSCGNPPTTGEGEIVFLNSEAYTSKVQVSRPNQGAVSGMTMESSAKWIGADCGKLKSSSN